MWDTLQSLCQIFKCRITRWLSLMSSRHILEFLQNYSLHSVHSVDLGSLLCTNDQKKRNCRVSKDRWYPICLSLQCIQSPLDSHGRQSLHSSMTLYRKIDTEKKYWDGMYLSIDKKETYRSHVSCTDKMMQILLNSQDLQLHQSYWYKSVRWRC